MLSESDLEIVHDNGTVTCKLDGITRPYDEHVAFINSLPRVVGVVPAGRPVRRRVAALVGVLGFSAGALAVLATHVRF